MAGILACAAMFAILAANFCFGLTKGRIVSSTSVVGRNDDPTDFWIALASSGFFAVLFGVLLLAFLDPRDFQPGLRLLGCKGPLIACLRHQFHQ